MAVGILEVNLVNAKGLQSTDLFGKIDPYVLIQYKGQTQKSSVAREEGRNPQWNERFVFRAEYPGSGRDYKLLFRIMDDDTFSRDDCLGEATVYVKDLLELGVEKGTAEIRPTKYSVVGADQTFFGEIQVGVTFEVKGDADGEEEEFGGYKHSEFY